MLDLAIAQMHWLDNNVVSDFESGHKPHPAFEDATDDQWDAFNYERQALLHNLIHKANFNVEWIERVITHTTVLNDSLSKYDSSYPAPRLMECMIDVFQWLNNLV